MLCGVCVKLVCKTIFFPLINLEFFSPADSIKIDDVLKILNKRWFVIRDAGFIPCDHTVFFSRITKHQRRQCTTIYAIWKFMCLLHCGNGASLYIDNVARPLAGYFQSATELFNRKPRNLFQLADWVPCCRRFQSSFILNSGSVQLSPTMIWSN